MVQQAGGDNADLNRNKKYAHMVPLADYNEGRQPPLLERVIRCHQGQGGYQSRLASLLMSVVMWFAR